jgi:Arc/MetJ family transcription regulator
VTTSGRIKRKNLMVDADAVAALARARGTTESEAVRQAIAEALADEVFNAASRNFFANRALRKTFSDPDHLRQVYGEDLVRQLIDAETPAVTAASRTRTRRSRTAA